MTTTPLYSSTASKEARFNAFMMAFAIYTPVFAFFNAGGFLVIYLLGNAGIIDAAPGQLLAISGFSVLLGLAFLGAGPLLRRRRDDLVAFIMPAAIGVFFLGLNLFWEGYLPFFYAGVWMAPILQFWQAAKIRQKAVAGGVGVVATLGLYFSESAHPFERMANTSNASTFGFWFLVFAVITLVIMSLLLQVVVFRSLSNRLLASFLVIVFLPLIITMLISGLSTSAQDQRQILQQLNTISQLKQNQIELVITPLNSDLVKGLRNVNGLERIQDVLTAPPASTRAEVSRKLATEYLSSIVSENSQYQEFFVLDGTGRVVLSTLEESIGVYYTRALFYQRGFQENRVWIVYNPFSDLSRFGDASLIATYPIQDDSQKTIGVAALRASFDAIDRIMAVDPGIGATDVSYLVNEQYTRITPSNAPVENVRTDASLAALTGRNVGVSSYVDNDGVPVVGAYRYISDLNVAMITELSQEESQEATRSLLITNILLSLLTAAVASMAVVITARTISTPITKLAGAVEQVARGNFYERADIERDDEIGALANSFNSMADELQQLVTSLEARVAERTEDLEKQASRLRVAAEVARDAATARSLDQLLNRSAQLILDRFGFYHTGIFLLDHNREYAVLRASPTPAGQEMLARQHRLRVGETGIVGYVAATGEPRIALDTGADAVYFRNPLLPQTRSELALPLKVENRVIGVLDVQSDQPEAFKQDDIATLQIMADQLGTAIERARLLQEFEQSLGEIERVYQRFTRESWQGFIEHQKAISGYRFDGLNLVPLAEVPAEARQALKRGTTASSSGEGVQRATLSVPVKLRGQTLGVINVKLQGDLVPPDTAALVDEAAARLAFALENSRLIVESQQRAGRERAIANASAKIGASRDTEQIMRAAVEELQHLLGDPEVAIQLKTDQDRSA